MDFRVENRNEMEICLFFFELGIEKVLDSICIGIPLAAFLIYGYIHLMLCFHSVTTVIPI